MLIVARLLQFSKALLPMLVKKFGNSIEDRFVQLSKALFPMLDTDEGIEKNERLEQPLNA